MSDAGRLEEFNSHPSKFRFEHNYSKHDGPDCHGPSPAHREALKSIMSLDRTFTYAVDAVAGEAAKLILKKQADYGPLNIANAPGGALNGLRVRIFDKISRINNLIDTGATPENESLRDSFIDLANYGLIALMVLDGTWPELPEEKK